MKITTKIQSIFISFYSLKKWIIVVDFKKGLFKKTKNGSFLLCFQYNDCINTLWRHKGKVWVYNMEEVVILWTAYLEIYQSVIMFFIACIIIMPIMNINKILTAFLTNDSEDTNCYKTTCKIHKIDILFSWEWRSNFNIF